MSTPFEPTKPFGPDDFPDKDKSFPIVEVFGYHRDLVSEESRAAFTSRICPFAGNQCEKFRQYGYGYCSVTYKADGDKAAEIYAVCDHRFDGSPISMAVDDFFGPEEAGEVAIVPEVVLTHPRQSFDFIALPKQGQRFCAIEAQAIDLRGGGVGPAFHSILEGDPKSWRRRFTEEAKRKGRKDTVAYGVNTANIYKRLGLQVAEKAAMLVDWGSKLYVVTQKRPFDYLIRRTDIEWTTGDDWDVTFLVFDYDGTIQPNGQMGFGHVSTHRTTVETFSKALIKPTSKVSAEEFLRRVRKKAGLNH